MAKGFMEATARLIESGLEIVDTGVWGESALFVVDVGIEGFVDFDGGVNLDR